MYKKENWYFTSYLSGHFGLQFTHRFVSLGEVSSAQINVDFSSFFVFSNMVYVYLNFRGLWHYLLALG